MRPGHRASEPGDYARELGCSVRDPSGRKNHLERLRAQLNLWRASTRSEGCAVYSRLAAARRARLAELFSEWPEEKHEELAALLRRLAREIVPDAQAAAVPAPT